MMLLCLYTLSVVSHLPQALAFIHTHCVFVFDVLWQLQEFEVQSTPINFEYIREKIVSFIVSQIIDQKDEFYCADTP